MNIYRLQTDRESVRLHLPEDTMEVIEGDTAYFIYEFRCKAEQRYRMAAYFNGDGYEVKLLYPEYENDSELSGHKGHLYSDGRLCITSPGEAHIATLTEAYARSVFWAQGFTVVRAGYDFPWQEGAE